MGKLVKNIAGGIGDVVGELTGSADVERAAGRAGAATQALARQQADQLRLAGQQVQQAGQPYMSKIQNLLMGQTPVNQIPGYQNMLAARGEAIDDLSTIQSGLGKFFSGSTAEQAAGIGGQLQNQLMQQRLSNLGMGLSQATGLAGQGYGQAQDIANLLMGGQAASNQYAMQGAGARQQAMGDILGAAGTAAGLAMCDRRLKRDIKKIGKVGPYNWYQYKYIGDDTQTIGPMAQEVLHINPTAVKKVNGYLAVDMGAL